MINKNKSFWSDDAGLSSRSNEWETPQELYDELDKEFSFTLDPCATKESAKCDKYYTEEDNGLIQDWGGVVFMNPPYGRQINKCIEKAYKESLKGATVVCLIPARTDTRYWWDYIFPYAEIRFIKGRIKFKKDGISAPAPFPSAIVIFRSDND